jgi:hypothetical protein
MPTSMARGAATERIEIDLPAHLVSVLDGYCSAHDMTRPAVIKMLLKKWSKKKHAEAVSIVRVAGINPETPGDARN